MSGGEVAVDETRFGECENRRLSVGGLLVCDDDLTEVASCGVDAVEKRGAGLDDEDRVGEEAPLESRPVFVFLRRLRSAEGHPVASDLPKVAVEATAVME